MPKSMRNALWMVLFGLVCWPRAGGAVTVSVDPPDTTVHVGDEFVVRFVTDAFPALKGFELVFPYDATHLELMSASEGEVLTGSGGAYVGFLIPDVTAPADTFWYDAAMLDGTTQGPGVLVYARFKALATGDAAISCGSVDFRDSSNTQTIPACAGALVHIEVSSPPAVRISQVYGGGGNSGATYRNDFIELFNAGGATADLTGWTVQYASSTGTTWSVTPLAGTIPPGGYYLVQEAQGTGGTADLPAPDAIGSTAMSASSGKVALVMDAAALSGTCPGSAALADLVGYGSADCSETLPAPGLDNVTADLRHLEGCEDTDDNSANFSTGAPAPRNSATALHVCEMALTVTADPPAGGTIARSPDQTTYEFGIDVQLTATPAPGYVFQGWSGDASGPVNPLTVTMNADKTIVAHFSAGSPGGPVVISQVYGGGGAAGATWRNDFVELFNRGPDPVDLTGWSVQYASSLGTAWSATTLSGTIQPGQYYLVQEAAGGGGTTDLPAPDATGTFDLSAVSGKVALLSNATVAGGSCPGAAIEDLVGYGPADCAETVPTAALDDSTAAHRLQGGCVDTDDNLADFETLAPAPRNSATPIHVCDFWVGVNPAATGAMPTLGVWPNPAHATVRVDFGLPRSARGRLAIYDLQGRLVATLADGVLAAGHHEVHWSGATPNGPARSGVYFVRLQAGGLTLRRALVMTR